MRGRVAAIIVSGAMAALLGGCGDDKSPIETISTTSDTTGATSGVSQDDFVASADAACAEANAALANLADDTSSVVVGQRLGINQEVLSAIQTLGDPEDPNGDLHDFLAALRHEVSILEDQQAAASSGDTATVDSLATELSSAEAKAQSAASAYGFDECGQPPSASTAAPTGGTAPGGTSDSAPTTPSTTVPAPAAPAPEPAPTPPTGGAGAGPAPAPTPTPTPPADGGGGGGSSGGFSP